MSKSPSFQFYPGDWIRDIKLQSCSFAAQGLLINLMCLIHQSKKYGFLTINGSIPDHKTIAKLLRISQKKFEKWSAELLENGVLIRGNCGVYICKRMVEDQTLRDKRAESGRAGGNPNLVNQKLTTMVNLQTKSCTPPSSSSSSSSSASHKRIKDTCPEPKKAPGLPVPASPVFLSIPIIGNNGNDHPVTEADVKEWKELFPGVDVQQQLRAIKAWNLANPTKRKTERGIRKHIVAWLTKEHDRGPSMNQAPRERTVEEVWEERQRKRREEAANDTQ